MQQIDPVLDAINNSEAYVHTQGGRFYLNSPTFDVHSMAHALSQCARFNGNSDEFYSVAEHSVLVSLLMEELNLGNPLEGLLHDGVEAFLSDIPAPFKGLLRDWAHLEDLLDRQLRVVFGLPITKTKGCETADKLALFIEAAQIVPERGEDFDDPMGLRPRALRLRESGWRVTCMEWKTAKAVFLKRYEEIINGTENPRLPPKTKSR